MPLVFLLFLDTKEIFLKLKYFPIGSASEK